MSLAALIRSMAAAGASAEAIALAVEAIEAEQNKAAEKRARAAQRKADQRSREAAERDSHATVTRQSQDCPSLEVSPQTPLPKPNPVSAPLNPPKSKGRKALVIQVPDWMPAEPWLEFVAMRKAMRNVPFTEGAAKGVIREIEKFRAEGHCPELLLRKAVTRGWRTVFGDEDTKVRSGPVQPTTPESLEETAKFFERIGRGDEAEEYRKRAARMRDPPRKAVNG